MRPTRLDLEGFASFRDPVSVDFADADLFVLSGSTGSGKCLPADTPVYEGKTGRRMSLRNAVEARVDTVVGYSDGRVTSVPVTDWHHLGEKPTVTIRTKDGRSLNAAMTHPVVTDRGVVPAGDVEAGDWLAQPQHLDVEPPPQLTPDEGLLLGLLLGDGSIGPDRGIKFTNSDPDLHTLFASLVHQWWPNAIIRRQGSSITYRVSNPKGQRRREISEGIVQELEARGAHLPEYLSSSHLAQQRRGERAIPLAVIEQIGADLGIDVLGLVADLYPSRAMSDWLDSLQVARKTTLYKAIPDHLVLQGGDAGLALLSGLILTDGWCTITTNRGRTRTEIGFASASPKLAEDFRCVATSCGLGTHAYQRRIHGHTASHVSLDVDAVRAAGAELRLVGRKARVRDEILRILDQRSRQITHDRLPPRFNDTLERHGSYGPRRTATTSLSRDTFLDLGGDPHLANGETRWVRVTSTAAGPVQDCYDLTVDTAEHLYVADHWIVHNSSVVDSMMLALYGCVPRYDDRRMIAPVISQGRAEARVRLDFSVGDHQYTTVRVVRRTKTGATTKEARLEQWRDREGTDRVTLAGTADEVTEQVEALLGLRFEHFTSCIVLPQGAFQHFLHARPKDRQDLLVQLLDLDVYRRVGQAARDRATAEQQQVEVLQRRLDGELAAATPEAIDEAHRRIDDLEALRDRLDEAQPQLDEIQQSGTRLREEARTARARADLLAGVRPPQDLDEVVSRLHTAREGIERTEAELEAAGTRVEQATTERQEAGEEAPLARQLERLGERDQVHDRLLEAEARVEQTTARVKDADTRLATAEQALDTAREVLRTAQHRDLVAAVVADHEAGDPCPVCDRPLEQVPDTAGGTDLQRARDAVGAAEDDRDRARRDHQAAETEAARAQAERDGQRERLAQLDADIATAVEQGQPDTPEQARSRLQHLRALDEAVTAAREAERQARTARRTAQEALAAARERHADVEAAFTQACERLAELRPPRPDRDDLGQAWRQLVAWAEERRPELLAQAEEAERQVAEAADRWKAEAARLREDCVVHGVQVGDDERPRDATVRDLERTRARHERLCEQRDEAAKVRRELTTAQRDQRVATALGQHLRSSNFEKWLLNRALRLLVQGATATLRELSGGAYSLTLDDAAGFAVVDHRNADEVRSARTLSGGETFLASLSLALALSEHVADLAAQGAARLESLILDEGFGTLDAETLDVVATALEELGSRGRMIGVITHVEALAERLPVRFAVRKEAGTSQVERVAG